MSLREIKILEAAAIRGMAEPAVLRGLVADWPMTVLAGQSDEALVDYLKAQDNGRPAGVYVGAPDIGGHFFYGEDATRDNFRFGPAPIPQALDRILSERTNPAPTSVYVQSAPMSQHMPAVAAEHRLDVLPDVEPRIWIGNATVTRAHYDLNNNIACVVAGRRRVWLLPPEQLPNLYPGPFDRTIGGVPVAMVDVEAPDLDRYPRFAEARGHMLVVDLEPGDAVYIPYGWWHQVRALSAFNVLVNFWWNDAVTAASPYDALFHGLLAIRDLPPAQRDVWRNLFDHYVFERNGDPVAHLAPSERGSLGALTPELANRIKSALRQGLG